MDSYKDFELDIKQFFTDMEKSQDRYAENYLFFLKTIFQDGAIQNFFYDLYINSFRDEILRCFVK